MNTLESTIKSLQEEVSTFTATDKESLEKFRIKYFSRKGVLSELFEELKKEVPERKKDAGRILNELKQSAETKVKEIGELLEAENTNATTGIDLTLPPVPNQVGNLHPLTLTRYKIIDIFQRLGFSVADGPEIEDDWHNFSALNFPENHPAREMQDTFFIQKKSGSNSQDILLRTHTSNVQIRLMRQQKPPIRAIMPGRVYRNE